MVENGIYQDKMYNDLFQVNLCDDETFPYEIKDLNGRYVNKGKESFIHERYEYVGKQIPIKPMPTIEPLHNLIDHPPHYTTGKVEVIDYIVDKLTAEQFEGYCIGNVLKYVSRYRHKGGHEDLRKAVWYLNRVIGDESK